jgi:hypothetical protein
VSGTKYNDSAAPAHEITVRALSAFLRQHVVVPLNDMGVPIDLHDVQLVMVLLPVALVVAAFMRVSSKKRQRMKDAGM